MSSLRRGLPIAAWSPLGTLAVASSRAALVLLILAGLAAFLALAVLAFIGAPAVWSKNKERREAAIAVLRTILGRPG